MRSTRVQLGITALAAGLSLGLLAYLGTPPRMSAHAAIDRQRVDVLEKSLRWTGPVDARDQFGMTPLHMAACLGRLRAARWLIEHGAEVEAQDSNGWSPLFWAYFGLVKVRQGRPITDGGNYRGVIDLLRRHGALEPRQEEVEFAAASHPSQ